MQIGLDPPIKSHFPSPKRCHLLAMDIPPPFLGTFRFVNQSPVQDTLGLPQCCQHTDNSHRRPESQNPSPTCRPPHRSGSAPHFRTPRRPAPHFRTSPQACSPLLEPEGTNPPSQQATVVSALRSVRGLFLYGQLKLACL